jgi:hypothetical protein
VGFVALLRAGEESTAVQGLAARATIAPVAALFGDALDAEVEVALDPARVDADSVLVSVDFGTLDGPALAGPERSDAGSSQRLRYRYRLYCLRDSCRPRGGRRELELPPAVVRYRLVDGTSRRLRLEWPGPIVLGSRLSAADEERPVFRVREHPLPAVSHRVRPAVAAAVGYALAALLAAAALTVLLREARKLAQRGAPDPLAGLSPLERALALLARAVADGGTAPKRRALDRLARELRRTGDDELATQARRLAWSRARPGGKQVAAVAAAAAAKGSV